MPTKKKRRGLTVQEANALRVARTSKGISKRNNARLKAYDLRKKRDKSK